MLRNTTKAVTLERVKLDFFVVEDEDPALPGCIGIGEFERNGTVVASRPILSEIDEGVGADLFENPVHVSLLAGENADGDVNGVLLAHVPMSMIAEEEGEEPWQASVPSYPGDEAEVADSADDEVPLYPLGVLSRPHHEREHPDNFYEESRSMLRTLLNVPVTDEAECALETLLNDIGARWPLGSF